MPTKKMKKALSTILLIAILIGCKCQTSGNLGFIKPVTPSPLIVFWGESNSGGYGLNSAASAPELATRNLQIFNNTQTETFQNLRIGVNNSLGHSGLDSTLHHGWELELANLQDSGTIPPVYLCKNGQGGSIIQFWVNPGALIYQNRWVWPDSAKKLLTKINNGVAPKMFIFYSQGINDMINNTDTTAWKNDTELLFDSIRARYGSPTPIFMTYFVGAYTLYNHIMDKIVLERPDVYVIQTSDASGDGTHWDYAGMKIIGRRMVTTLLANYSYY